MPECFGPKDALGLASDARGSDSRDNELTRYPEENDGDD